MLKCSQKRHVAGNEPKTEISKKCVMPGLNIVLEAKIGNMGF